MPAESVLIEFLDDGTVEGTALSDDSSLVELLVTEVATVKALEIVEYIEFDDSRGPAGPVGPAGASGSHLEYIQSAAAATWTWVHNLGTRPAVTLFLSGAPSELVYTDVSYPDLNTVVIEWPSAESGKAYI